MGETGGRDRALPPHGLCPVPPHEAGVYWETDLWASEGGVGTEEVQPGGKCPSAQPSHHQSLCYLEPPIQCPNFKDRDTEAQTGQWPQATEACRQRYLGSALLPRWAPHTSCPTSTGRVALALLMGTHGVEVNWLVWEATFHPCVPPDPLWPTTASRTPPHRGTSLCCPPPPMVTSVRGLVTEH